MPTGKSDTAGLNLLSKMLGEQNTRVKTAPDMTGQYNTKLSPVDEAKFQQWAVQNNRLGDLKDYDMRGAWQAGASQAGNGHFTDQFKKPNHPTFSTESQYSTAANPGGQWQDQGNGKWNFQASLANLTNLGTAGMQTYMKKTEPDSTWSFQVPDITQGAQ